MRNKEKDKGKMRVLLRSERERMRYSIAELSKECEVSEDYFLKLEWCNVDPSFEYATRIYETMIKLGMNPNIGIKKLFNTKK